MRMHLPVVSRSTTGDWNVWCLACSDREQDYTYPCTEPREQDDWPPPVLVEP